MIRRDLLLQLIGTAGLTNGREIVKALGYEDVAGNPVGERTPEFIGEVVFNTVGAQFYIATGLTNSDWSVMSSEAPEP